MRTPCSMRGSVAFVFVCAHACAFVFVVVVGGVGVSDCVGVGVSGCDAVALSAMLTMSAVFAISAMRLRCDVGEIKGDGDVSVVRERCPLGTWRRAA